MAGYRLTKEDVARLVSDPSVGARVETVAKLAADFRDGRLSAAERAAAAGIFRLMVGDAEVRVRQALAENLKEVSSLPHEIAVRLARDVESVALPVLEFSEVLTDADLIEILRGDPAPGGEGTKPVAIAKRATLSEEVSAAVVATGNEAAVTTLVANSGAHISEASLVRVVDDHGASEAVHDAMVRRAKLPVTVAEKLLVVVSERLKAELLRRHDVAADALDLMALAGREKATLSLSSDSTDAELESLVRHLRHKERLTPSLILRAVCIGDVRFFEVALSELTGIPLLNTRQLIHDSGGLGLSAVLGKAGLPKSYYPAMRAAVDVAHENVYDGEARDRERYRRRMLERILTQYGDLGINFEAGDLGYLLTKIDELSRPGVGAPAPN